MRTLAAYNIKGGVGKTSTAVNLAYLAAKDGLRTLVWDLDPQGAATFLLGVKPRVKGGSEALVSGKRRLADAIRVSDHPGLDVVPADFSYRNLDVQLEDAKRPTQQVRRLLEPLSRDYEVVVLDCPPSISMVSENVFAAAQLLLVPVVPTTLSLRPLEQVTDFVAAMDKPRPTVRAFFSMVDRRKRLHLDVVRELPARHGGFMETSVPVDSVVERMGLTRRPVVEIHPSSRAALAYRMLWRECLPHLR